MARTKALIFDLDGTAVDTPSQLLPSDRLKSAISNLKDDYYICAATGRSWEMESDIIQFLELTDESIVATGTRIVNPITAQSIWEIDIEKEPQQYLYKLLKSYPYKAVVNDFKAKDYVSGGFDIEIIDNTKDLYIVNLLYMEPEKAKELLKLINNIDGLVGALVVAHMPGLLDIHITSDKATKEHTLKMLLKRLGVSKHSAWGFGDGYNDIHLFNAVGHKVAMGNAVPELKAVADEVIGDVKNDGLAEYFEQLSQ